MCKVITDSINEPEANTPVVMEGCCDECKTEANTLLAGAGIPKTPHTRQAFFLGAKTQLNEIDLPWHRKVMEGMMPKVMTPPPAKSLKFGVGDRVRVMHSTYQTLPDGSIGTITEIIGGKECYTVSVPNMQLPSYTCWGSELEAVLDIPQYIQLAARILAKKVAPLYKQFEWFWCGYDSTEAYIPKEKEIYETLISLYQDLSQDDDSCEVSEGGLACILEDGEDEDVKSYSFRFEITEIPCLE